MGFQSLLLDSIFSTSADGGVFPNTPNITPMYYNINSKEISRLMTNKQGNISDILFQIKKYEGNSYTDNKTKKIFLSRKSDIDTFDIFITNDKNEILSLNGGNMWLSLKFNSS